MALCSSRVEDVGERGAGSGRGQLVAHTARSKEIAMTKMTSKVRGTAKRAGPVGRCGHGTANRVLLNTSSQYKIRMESWAMQQ